MNGRETFPHVKHTSSGHLPKDFTVFRLLCGNLGVGTGCGYVYSVRLPCVGNHLVHVTWRLDPGHVREEKGDTLVKSVIMTAALRACAYGYEYERE